MTTNPNVQSLALGTFDGIHIAHQKLISNLCDDGILLVIGRSKANITPKEDRTKYSGKPVIYVPLKEIKELSGQEFINLLKHTYPNLDKIVIGYDFRFGKDRAYDAKDIKNFFDKQTIIIDEVKLDGTSVHSGYIRKLITEGKVKKLKNFLGRYYSFDAKVIKGRGIGKKQLFPTINFQNNTHLIPKEGIYATLTQIGNDIYQSASFIGHRVTLDSSFAMETHIIDQEITDVSDIHISFIDYIRDNEKFDSIKELKAKIQEDINKSKQILENIRHEL